MPQSVAFGVLRFAARRQTRRAVVCSHPASADRTEPAFFARIRNTAWNASSASWALASARRHAPHTTGPYRRTSSSSSNAVATAAANDAVTSYCKRDFTKVEEGHETVRYFQPRSASAIDVSFVERNRPEQPMPAGLGTA